LLDLKFYPHNKKTAANATVSSFYPCFPRAFFHFPQPHPFFFTAGVSILAAGWMTFL
jgi:hypothetical protein